MRRMLSIFAVLVLIVGLILPVFANEQKLVDLADLLTEAEEVALTRQAQDLAEQYGMDVVIVTIFDTDGRDIAGYADDYYDSNGYGLGPDYSGVLFLLAIDTREWAISTCGDARYALTDYGMGEIFEAMADDLSQDRFYWAFSTYLAQLSQYFQAYANGNPIDGYDWDAYDGPGYLKPADRDEVVHYPEEPKNYLGILFTSLLLGAAAGGIVLLVLRGQMKTDRAQSGAGSYLVRDSFRITRHQNLFLYSNVSRIRRQQQSSGGSRGGGRGGGGGSSVHRSSSGRSHGGRSGRF